MPEIWLDTCQQQLGRCSRRGAGNLGWQHGVVERLFTLLTAVEEVHAPCAAGYNTCTAELGLFTNAF